MVAQNRIPVSGVIVTLNEERRIESCVQSLFQVVDEVLVLDSGSTDQTCEIAQRFGCRVTYQSFLGSGPQRNLAAELAQHDWILNLDADECLDKELTNYLKALFRGGLDEAKAYAVCRKNFIGDQWIKHSGWYPDWVARLYNKKHYQFNDRSVHPALTARAQDTIKLSGYLLHASFRDLHDLFKKSNEFSTRTARILIESNRRVGRFSPVTHGVAAVLKKFIIQRGFLDGAYGFAIAISRGICSYLKYAKAREHQKTKCYDRGIGW